jgi:ABC-type dipeptide/oligopeptide/nickel transport system permease component
MGAVRKAASLAVAVWILLSLNFLAFYISSGDPMEWMVPKIGGTLDLRETVIDEARLDEPMFVQYADYLADTFTGDFRVSTGVMRGVDIQDFIWGNAGHTLALLSFGLVGSLALGAGLELAAGKRPGGARSALARGASLLLMAFPVFSLSLLLMVAVVELDLGLPLWGDGTPASGGEEADLLSMAEHMVLPLLVIVLTSAGFASLVMRERTTRSGVPGALHEGALTSIASFLAASRPSVHFYVAWTMAAVLLADAVFGYGGLGDAVLEASYNRDFPLMMAAIAVASLITMAAASLTSLLMRVLGGGRPGDLLADWGRREPVPEGTAPAAPRGGEASGDWTKSAWSSFRSSAPGMAALIVLCAVLALGVLAPVIAPAPDPSSLEYLEPYVYPEWRNPLPPSLDPSPYTGMTHLLGTDYLGRDVMSLWLFGALDAGVTVAVLVAGSMLIGMVVGILAAETLNVSGRALVGTDFILTAGARAMVAIPLPLFAAARLIVTRDVSFAPIVLMLAFYAWAWIPVARGVRRDLRASGVGVTRARRHQHIAAESLSVAKFAVPLVMLSDFHLYMIGLGAGSDVTWGRLLETAYSYSAFSTGDWHLIVPPLAGMVVVCAAAFVMLDRAEGAVRSAGGRGPGSG